MADLSPAAQAVLGAYLTAPIHNDHRIADMLGLAAAIRAAADQVVPEEESCNGGFSESLEHQCRASERKYARAELLAIAAELENTND